VFALISSVLISSALPALIGYTIPVPAFRQQPATLPANGPPLDALEGVIERITFHNEDNGYTVARLLPPNARDVITIIGNFSNPVVGESLLCYGTWTNHAQWGKQMNVARYEVVRPATAFAIEKYLGSGMVKGVGPVTAKRIVAKFGEDALDIIENHPRKLLGVGGIGEKTLAKITTAWKDQREVKNIMLFLQSHGVSPAYAVKIYKAYGSKSIEVVEKNPYQLASDIWGIGFKSADKIARAIGIAEDDPRRIEAGVVYVLNEAVESGGNAYLTQAELTEKAGEILGVGDVAGAIKILADSGRLVAEPFALMGDTEIAIYTPSLHKTEIGVAERIKSLLASPVPVPEATNDDWLSALLDKNGTALSGQQRESVQTALQSRFSVLTGGPGTGKTTTTNAIVAAFEALDKDVLLASPTGRAAKRMAEVTGREAKTVHRLLEFDPEQRGFKRGLDLPLECDVLIVDESSMLDMVLTYSLLKAVPPEAQVVFVGDVDQLPSVGPGNVLRDLIDSGIVPVSRLTQVFRQAAESLIITNAHAINAGRLPELPPPSANRDCAWLPADEADELAEKVVAVVAKSLPKRGYAPGDIQVLTPMQRGSAGAAHLNTRLQEVLNPPRFDKPEIQRGIRLFRVGDRVMQIVNNYDKAVYNGDIGAVVAIDLEEEILTVAFTDAQGTNEVLYEFADIDELTLAYACSIHKCVAGYERVWTENRGLVTLRDIVSGDRVLTENNSFQPVVHAVPTGKKPIVRITTQAGYQIDVSREHPIFVNDGDSSRFVVAGELQVGQLACISRGEARSSLPVSLPPLPILASAVRKDQPVLSLPSCLNTDLAWLLGAIIGDGSYRDRKDGTVDFTNQDPQVLCRFRAILESYGLRVCRYTHPSRRAERLYVISKAFRQWLTLLGLDYSTACAKDVPDIIFRSDILLRAAFLRGLFDTDGSAGTGTCRTCRLVTCSQALAQQVQMLLLSLGIVSHQRKSGPNAYCVGVSGTSLGRFQTLVGFSIDYKSERLQAILTRAATWPLKSNLDFIPGSAIMGAEVSASLKLHFGRSKGIKGKGVWANGETKIGHLLDRIAREKKSFSYGNAQALISHLEGLDATVPESLRSAAALHYYYDPIIAVEEIGAETEMYDLEVEGVHSFVANGFVCHNSQGSEYPAVVLAIHTQHYMLLQRNLLYTALTRAKKFAVLIGPKRAIAMAVKKQSDIHRHTRLKERLQGLI